MSTYREAIQYQQKMLEAIYANAEGLRDAATQEEKEAWNQLRRLTVEAASIMYKLDNSLSQNRALTQLNGNYTAFS